jgi:predicted ATPase
LTRLATSVGGEVAVENEEFFLRGEQGNIEFSLLAEGVRKLALLWLLIRNGALPPGSILFWDEPETNLNPKLFGVVMDVVLELQRHGVQVFLATHDYVILKELDLRTTAADKVAFHSLYLEEETGEVRCGSTYSYLEIHPNAIADTFTDLYDREIERSLASTAG